MTTDKARAEACLNELQDLLGRIHNPGPEEAAQQIIEKHLTARDAEAALAKWQHEAEGLREAVRVLLEAAEESYRHFRSLSKVDQSVVWDAMCDHLSKSMSIAKAAIDAAGGA